MDLNQSPGSSIRIPASVHYYGDIVRTLFIVAAILMFLERILLASYPFTDVASIATIVILVITAGITNPTQMWIQWVNLLVSAGGVITYALFTIRTFGTIPMLDSLVSAALTLIFLGALYYATRTVRGLLVGSKLPIR